MNAAENERRLFPRIPADCPVLFRCQSNHKWKLGKMMDFSATGLSLVCPDSCKEEVTIEFQVKPGDNSMIPAITGYAQILRCIPMPNNEFHISCSVSKVNVVKKVKGKNKRKK